MFLRKSSNNQSELNNTGESQHLAYVLNDVKESGTLGRSKRQYQLLEYLLNKKFKNQQQNIGEYSIAVDLGWRDESFDKNSENIIRSQMYRLRKNLTIYSAQSRTISIELPLYTYNIELNLNLPPIKPISKWHFLFGNR